MESSLKESRWPAEESKAGAAAAEQKIQLPPFHGRRLAYLLSHYPAVSHTFFLNEIRELRILGFTIDVASINTPEPPSDGATAREIEEFDSTFYIKGTAAPRAAVLLLKVLVTQPRVVWRGLRAALRLDPWNLYASGYALMYLAEALLLGVWMRERGHRHLHIHFGGPVATVGMLASIAWGLPYSLMIHGPDEFYDVERFYLRSKIERARFVFCISDYCRSQVMKLCDPSHWSKLQVLRLGVDPDVFAPSRPGESDTVLEIVCVGRLVPTKGQLVLLAAVRDLLERGHRVRLRLIGEGTDRRRLEAFIREHGLGGAILLEGARNHESTRNLLRNAHIFVLASFAEGLPVSLMEAMAMEIPCVSSYVAAIPELIRNGVDGLLVAASSQADLSSAIEQLIVDPELRKRLAASGRRRVLELYNLKQNVRALAAALETRLSEPL
ncbi:MAG TPA: glycosyltransferase family 4 protein [Acidobacteriaceae bacterium]|nr:glycosyltransferase family 4 protein [Acidobacteriaceae bacterium]